MYIYVLHLVDNTDGYSEPVAVSNDKEKLKSYLIHQCLGLEGTEAEEFDIDNSDYSIDYVKVI